MKRPIGLTLSRVVLLTAFVVLGACDRANETSISPAPSAAVTLTAAGSTFAAPIDWLR